MSDLGSYPPPGTPPGGSQDGAAPTPPPPGSPAAAPAQQSWFNPVSPQTAAQVGQTAYPPPGYPAQAPGYYAPPVAAAAHKPGVIPLRPLGLGDIYDGAFKIIRFSPGATVGSAVLVTAVAMAIPLAITGILTAVFDLSLSSLDSADPDTADIASLLAGSGTVLAGAILQGIGLIFVTGMIAHVTAAAAVGRKLTLAESWAATAGKRGKLVGLTGVLLLGTVAYLAASVAIIVLLAYALPEAGAVLAGVLLGIALTCGLVFGWARLYYLAVPPLLLEPVGVFGALGRAWRLTSDAFWRTFGIALLTILVTQVAGGMLGVPFSIVGEVARTATGDGEVGLLVYLSCTALASVMSAAFVAPFTSAVTTLQYVDLRMRKEGYDVELLTRAGVPTP